MNGKKDWLFGKDQEADKKPEGRNQDHDRHPCFAVRLELPKGNAVSVMYGTFIGSPSFDPSLGIHFVFEAMHPTKSGWKEGKWQAEIKGSNLRPIYEHLCLSKQKMIRIGVNGEDNLGNGDVPLAISPDEPEVTAINVTEVPKA